MTDTMVNIITVQARHTSIYKSFLKSMSKMNIKFTNKFKMSFVIYDYGGEPLTA